MFSVLLNPVTFHWNFLILCMFNVQDLLQKEDETITGCSAKTSLILSEDLLKRRQHILEQFNKALENGKQLLSYVFNVQFSCYKTSIF